MLERAVQGSGNRKVHHVREAKFKPSRDGNYSKCTVGELYKNKGLHSTKTTLRNRVKKHLKSLTSTRDPGKLKELISLADRILITSYDVKNLDSVTKKRLDVMRAILIKADPVQNPIKSQVYQLFPFAYTRVRGSKNLKILKGIKVKLDGLQKSIRNENLTQTQKNINLADIEKSVKMLEKLPDDLRHGDDKLYLTTKKRFLSFVKFKAKLTLEKAAKKHEETLKRLALPVYYTGKIPDNVDIEPEAEWGGMQ